MATLQLRHSWTEVKRRLKEQYGFLSDDDLEFREGEEEKLLEHLEEKLHIPKRALREYIEAV